MAEENTDITTAVNPLTSMPMNGKPTMESGSPSAFVNPLTNTAYTPSPTQVTLGGNQGSGFTDQLIYSSTKHLNRGEPVENFLKYNVPLGQNLDWEEIRAQNQSTAEKWGNGLAKMGTTALGAVAENTIGVFFGLGEMASGGSYYDNSIGQSVDRMNEWMQEHMPNYYTQEERAMSTFQKLGTANFWSDTVANGLGYSLGSIASMYLMGGQGWLTKLGGLGKGTSIYNSAKAIVNGTRLGTALAKGAGTTTNVMRALQMLEVGAMMSLAEGSVEARETQKSVYNDLTQKYMQDNNLRFEHQIPADIRNDIEKTSYAAGNTNFVSQMPVLMGTNLLMFGNMAQGYNAAKQATKDVVFDAATNKAVSKFANDGIWKGVAERLSIAGAQGIEEAFQEGYQYFSGQFSSQYYTDKYHNGGYADMSKALNDALSKTFGTQEGRETMLVGFLTGGIMSGGQTAVQKFKTGQTEYSARKTNASSLAEFINGGYLFNTQSKMQNAQAQSAALKRMQGFLKRGDINGFKNEQQNLYTYHALEALERGGFDILMERLDDSSNMTDEQFIEHFGYRTHDDSGNALTLEDQAGGKSKVQIVEGLKNKLNEVKNVYEKVNDRFAIPERKSGLNRLLMSEQARAAEDAAYKKQENLRTELILRGVEVKDRTRRMASVEKQMQKTIDDSLARDNKLMRPGVLSVPNALQDLSQYKTKPGEMDAKDYDPRKQYEDIMSELNEAETELRKTDPIAADQLKSQIADYGKLMFEPIYQRDDNGNPITDANGNPVVLQNRGIIPSLNVYNKLASDPFAQEALSREIERQEEIARNIARAKQVAETAENAKTSKEVVDNVPEDATEEEKAILRKKYLDLKKEEDKAFNKYMKSKGTTTDERLNNLLAIDKESLSPVERAGLEAAIDTLEALSVKEALGEVEVISPQEQQDELADREEVKRRLEEAFAPENIGGIESVSEDGRSFQIEGELYENKEAEALDAIIRDDDGTISSIKLTDSRGNTVFFYAPESRVDGIAYAILMSEMIKAEGQPSVDRAEAQAKAEALREATERIANSGKHGNKTSESLQQEIYEHERLLDEALDNYDDLRTLYIQEAGATKEDIKQDPELRELKRRVNSLRGSIAARKRVLRARGVETFVTPEAILKTERKALEFIQESEDRKAILQNELIQMREDAKAAEEAMERFKQQDDYESYREAKQDRDTLNQMIKDGQKELLVLRNAIDIERKKLKRLENEKSNRLPGTPEQAESGITEETQRQVDEGEDQINREGAEETQADVEDQQLSLFDNEEGLDNTQLRIERQAEKNELEKRKQEPKPNVTPAAPTGMISGNDVWVQMGYESKEDFDRDMAEMTKGAPVGSSSFGDALKEAAQEQKGGSPTSRITDTDEMDLDLNVRAASSDQTMRVTEPDNFGNLKVKNVIPVSEDGKVDIGNVNTINDKPIIVNRELIRVGEDVEFEIIENDFFVDNHKGKDTEIEQLPVYFKIGGEIAGMLEAGTMSDRVAIINKLRAGEKVTSKITNIVAGNLNNSRVKGDNSVYFNNPKEIFGNNVNLAFSYITDGVRTIAPGMGLSEAENMTIEQGLAAKQGGQIGLGQVMAIVTDLQHPNDEYGISTLSTANLTPEAQNYVLDQIKNNGFDNASKVVANQVYKAANANNPSYLDFDSFGVSGDNFLVYRSPATGKLIRVSEPDAAKAAKGLPFKLGFVAPVKEEGETETYVPITEQPQMYEEAKDRFIEDFATFLKGKKYHIDRALANTEGAYTSPVTNIPYTSYKEYLFDTKEMQQYARTEGVGHHSILSTDVSRTSTGLYHNPEIKFSKGELKGKTIQEVTENVNFASTNSSGNINDIIKAMGGEQFIAKESSLLNRDKKQDCD